MCLLCRLASFLLICPLLRCVKVIDETLSPTWDEMLIFNEVVIFGSIDYLRVVPPTIVVEIFDQDRLVSDALPLPFLSEALPWHF